MNQTKIFTALLTGIASFAQERIFLDEQVRFSNKTAIYNELSILRVIQGSLSVDHLLRALRYVLRKHKILRTSLRFDSDDGTLRQYITDKHETFTLASDRTFKNETQLQDIIYQTTVDLNLFDLSEGRVFHCQILREHKSASENNDNEFLTNSDVLIIAFHHAATDRASRPTFFNDLCIAYNNKTTWSEDEESLQYIDYTVHEREIDMTPSREFWYSQLEGYNVERRLSLPVNQHRLSSDQRSGYASVSQFSFDSETTQSFLDYASSHHITPFQLGLATFYAFLLKLTNGQNDLCISCLNANRYRSELQNMTGMFVSALPYRLQIDSHWSFDELVTHIREKCLSILEHSHYPLQHILADSHHQQSSAAFLETVFDVITVFPDMKRLILNETELEPVLSSQVNHVAKFDSMFTLIYDPSATKNIMSCSLVFSADVFDQQTVKELADRVSILFRQLFNPVSAVSTVESLYKLSIILPYELTLIHALNHNDDSGYRKTQTNTIGELFIEQAVTHSQKIAVELDEQSLSYNELLYYVQKCGIHLLLKHDVKSGEIICQCIERSLSMVSSSFNIIGKEYICCIV